jgi:hypothetical protein
VRDGLHRAGVAEGEVESSVGQLRARRHERQPARLTSHVLTSIGGPSRRSIRAAR